MKQKLKKLRLLFWNLLFRVKNQRTIIVHVHIFKNAGSTFDSILEKNFGADFVDHRDDDAMIKGGAEYLNQLINENKTLKAISSHHIYFDPKKAENDTIKIIPVYFLRDPIERVLSVYKFERKQDPITPGAIHAKKYDLNDYVIWRMRPDVGGIIRNANTRFCAGRGRNIIINEEYLKIAQKNLLLTPCVGFVDRFDESIVLFKNTLSKYYPFMSFKYQRQNINQEVSKTANEKMDEIRELLQEDTWNLLLHENSFDILLDNYARGLMDGRVHRC